MEPQNVRTSRILFRTSRTLLLILALASLGTLVIAVDLLWEGRQWGHVSIAGAGPKDLTQEAQLLRQKLDAYDKRADDLKTLTSLLLGLSTLYAAVLGAGSYLGIQDATKRAEDSVNDLHEMKREAKQEARESAAKLESQRLEAKQEAREAVLEIRAQLPLFRYMDQAMKRIETELAHLFPPVTEWSRDYYNALTARDRLKIMHYEKAVAVFEFLDLEPFRHAASEIYHCLGTYYGLKYARDVKEKRQSEDDLERSRLYLDWAIRHDGKNIGALNDRGFLALMVDPAVNLDQARSSFAESLRIVSDQQRARCYLALVEHRQKNYARAHELLTEALTFKKWQTQESLPRYRLAIYYNRACARARLAEQETDPSKQLKLFESAFEDLERVFPTGEKPNEARVSDLINDLRKEGDLYSLSAQEALSPKVKALLARITEPPK